MSGTLYYVVYALLSLGVLYGVKLLSKVETAKLGNRVSALFMLLAIVLTMIVSDLQGSLIYIISGFLIGTLLSVYMTIKVKMIMMPQMVGLLNGLGGLSSGLAAMLAVAASPRQPVFALTASGLALAIGAVTFSGSMVAAGKLHRVLPQRPLLFWGQRALSAFVLLLLIALSMALPVFPGAWLMITIAIAVLGLVFGILFSLRVGGADMPIAISLLNSTSGVAAAVAGMALNNILLVTIGGIVGASGLLLTRIMCRAMNRSLSQVLLGGTARQKDAVEAEASETAQPETPAKDQGGNTGQDVEEWIRDVRSVVIVPGYGMAVSQAQGEIRLLMDTLEAAGKTVRFAIHPVAGRMPGHMNVLLAEVDIPYEKLFELEKINPDFPTTDLVIVVGANDVVNPAANTAQGTPIYGMPVLDVAKARRLIICNFDKQPGYAGVPNPLYDSQPNIWLMPGDAKDSVSQLVSMV